ncbi:MAG TPA: IS630 family transposase [Bacteriovoracaceae bacterium]|nr:IS630 family transposase [Bacteriovoracaceae bacterium]
MAPVLKKNEYRFCRARTSLKWRQLATEREEKEKQLSSLWRLYLGGRIDLYFGDESAFSMNPKLPYGWSKKGERIEIFPQRDKKVNLFGVFRPDNFCVTYESKANINSEFLIKVIADFCRYVDKPTVLVLDNAPTHRSRKFIEQMEKWMKQDLYIFFLPKYSPHLNLAETFWRKAKYEWLRPSDYGSFAKYKKKIKNIFNNIGTEYKIAFSQMTV